MVRAPFPRPEIPRGLAEVAPHRHAVLVSDADLRELERRWRETGCVEDEAAWLVERVRVGELEQRDLDLARCLGHAPACGEVRLKGQLRYTGDWYELARQLQDWGLHATLRATVSAVRVSQPVGRCLLRVEQVESWLCGLEPEPDPVVEPGDPLFHSGMPGYWLGEIWTMDRVLPTVPEALAGVTSWAMHAGSAMHWAKVSETAASRAFRDELVPWALGYGDPVRDRVEARQRADAAGD